MPSEGEETIMRQPLQVTVFLFPQDGSRTRVRDLPAVLTTAAWQGVAGGVEEGEDLATAARRETAEEAGLTGSNPLYKLDMTSGVARTWFAASQHWAAGFYIVPKHNFAMDATGDPAPVVLSHEHSEFRWASHSEASAALRYDDDKTALWELHARLQAGDLPATQT